MMRVMKLKLALKQRALDIGFDLVGIAPLVPGKDLVIARQWVERGYSGEMRYLANPKRYDPRLVLASAKSVVCVGLVYNTPLPYSTEVRSQKSEVRRKIAAEPGGVPNFEFPVSPRVKEGGQDAPAPRAWVSRYAWGRDYHEIVRAKLEELRAAVERLAPDVETRVFVDTGPIVERAFARFSGLGWMGKNTCIINEAKGSWLFLGVMLTSLEVEPDVPAADRCGSCTACLEACPTGALVEPCVMDASRCISYLTIELKGSIPEQSRSAIGANVFGCDICQDVCPWNRKNRIQKSGVRNQERGFEPLAVTVPKLETGNSKLGQVPRPRAAPNERPTTNNGLGRPVVTRQSTIVHRQPSVPSTQHPEPSTFSLFNPPLEALASLSEGDFRRIFARSPLRRAKYRGWLRNLCVAMGNSGDPQFIPWLERAREHPDPVIREHAAWALKRLQT
jgi:epoxyqueuosine reductase